MKRACPCRNQSLSLWFGRRRATAAGRRPDRGAPPKTRGQARPVRAGVREAVLGPHADRVVVGQRRMGRALHQTLPEPFAAPGQLRSALLHRGQ